jgi:hypothetical protein
MKKITLLACAFLLSLNMMAQAPQKMSYQSVVRNSNGELISNQSVSVRISILQGSASGTSVFVETHQVNTNINGLATLQIGNGTNVSGTISAIDWSNGPYFIKTETDPSGGSNYALSGTTELLSVPYALYAANGGTPGPQGIPGNDGVSVTNSQVVGDSLFITLNNGQTINAGEVRGATGNDGLDGVGVTNTQVIGDSLFVTLDNGQTINAGEVKGATGNDGTDGLNGVSVTSTQVINDSLIVQLSNGQTINAGLARGPQGIPGQDGTSVSILGSFNSTNDLPATGNVGDGYLVNGNLYVWDAQNNNWSNAGNIQGPVGNDGVGISQALINNDNDLILVKTNGDSINAGNIAANVPSFWQDNLNNTGIMYNDGNVGIRQGEPNAQLHVFSDSVAILGFSSASTPDQWRNVGVKGDVNTDNGTGRGVNGSARGLNEGYGVFGESATDGVNRGVMGWGLSKTNNANSYFGVIGIARNDWDNSPHGTGNGFGGRFETNGMGAFNIGVSGSANTENPNANNRGGEFAANSLFSSNTGSVSFAAANNGGLNQGAFGVALGGLTNFGLRSQVVAEGDFNVGNYIVTEGNNANGQYHGIRTLVSGNGTFNSGMYAEVFQGTTSGFNIGVDGTSRSDGAINIGVGGYATGDIPTDSAKANYGVYGFSQNALFNFGVFSTATNSQSTPASENYGIYAEAANATDANFAGYFVGDVVIEGNVNITGNIAKAGGTFKIDHPLDPENKYLVHSFVESPEMMNVYNGNIETDASGFANVTLPDYFETANKDFRYQLTVIGKFAQAIVAEEIKNNQFVIQTNEPNVKVSWQITGIRNDKYAQENRINPEPFKEDKAKGKYLNPELYGSDKAIYGKKGNIDNNKINELKKQTYELEKTVSKEVEMSPKTENIK